MSDDEFIYVREIPRRKPEHFIVRVHVYTDGSVTRDQIADRIWEHIQYADNCNGWHDVAMDGSDRGIYGRLAVRKTGWWYWTNRGIVSVVRRWRWNMRHPVQAFRWFIDDVRDYVQRRKENA